MKRKKVRLKPSEVKAHLTEQARFLRASCRAFDAGDEAESKRLATTIRVLVHSTQRSRSLLHQVDTFRWRFADSAFPFNEDNLLNHHGLVAVELTSPPVASTRYVPRCFMNEALHPFVPFARWWDAIIFKDEPGNTFTRSDIVLAVANQDGGAHVDPELDEGYAGLSRDNSLGFTFTIDGKESGWPSNPIPATIRQIAHEILVTLEAAELVDKEGL